jgi:myo-inositol-1(or 4)-monophosphatase
LGTRYAAAGGAGATANGHPISAAATDALQDAIASVGDYAVGDGAETANRVRLPLNYELATR